MSCIRLFYNCLYALFALTGLILPLDSLNHYHKNGIFAVEYFNFILNLNELEYD